MYWIQDFGFYPMDMGKALQRFKQRSDMIRLAFNKIPSGSV